MVLASETLPAVSLRSWSHHDLALVEGLLSLPVVAIGFASLWIGFQRTHLVDLLRVSIVSDGGE